MVSRSRVVGTVVRMVFEDSRLLRPLFRVIGDEHEIEHAIEVATVELAALRKDDVRRHDPHEHVVLHHLVEDRVSLVTGRHARWGVLG